MNRAKRITGIVVLSVVVLTGGVWLCVKLYTRFTEGKKVFAQHQEWMRRRKQSWNELTLLVGNEIARFDGEVGLVIKDLAMDWQISYHKDTPFPSASLVKLPIMLALFYAVEEGRINLHDQVRLQGVYKTGGSGVLKAIKNGTPFTVEQLIELMITQSDNTAANMLISMLGFEYLNTMFRKMGLSETNLSRKMMDFTLRKRGVENYTTAEEMATLLEKLYRKKMVDENISEMCLTLLKQQHINDRIPARLPQETVVAHKTGLERRVCHDAGIVFTARGDYLICVLTSGERNSRKAKELISKLARYTYSYF